LWQNYSFIKAVESYSEKFMLIYKQYKWGLKGCRGLDYEVIIFNDEIPEFKDQKSGQSQDQ